MDTIAELLLLYKQKTGHPVQGLTLDEVLREVSPGLAKTDKDKYDALLKEILPFPVMDFA